MSQRPDSTLRLPNQANEHTEVNGPNACSSSEIDHSLRVLDGSQVELSMQHLET